MQFSIRVRSEPRIVDSFDEIKEPTQKALPVLDLRWLSANPPGDHIQPQDPTRRIPSIVHIVTDINAFYSKQKLGRTRKSGDISTII